MHENVLRRQDLDHSAYPSAVPVHNNYYYYEGFFAGGSLFWAKDQVKNETINDKLDLVINFYGTLKLRYRPLKLLMDATLISRKIHGEGLVLIRPHADCKKIRHPGMPVIRIIRRTSAAMVLKTRLIPAVRTIHHLHCRETSTTHSKSQKVWNNLRAGLNPK